MPAADGGEGIAAVLLAALGGTYQSTHVTGPNGSAVAARWSLPGVISGVVERCARRASLLLDALAERVVRRMSS